MVSLIKERQESAQFSKPKTEREALYEKYVKLCQRRGQKAMEVGEKLRTKIRNEESHDLTTAFVTF